MVVVAVLVLEVMVDLVVVEATVPQPEELEIHPLLVLLKDLMVELEMLVVVVMKKQVEVEEDQQLLEQIHQAVLLVAMEAQEPQHQLVIHSQLMAVAVVVEQVEITDLLWELVELVVVELVVIVKVGQLQLLEQLILVVEVVVLVVEVVPQPLVEKEWFS